MIDDQDVRDAFARMVASGPPPPSSADALAAGRRVRHRRTLLATGTTAAAVAAVLAASSVVGGGIGGGGGSPAAAPAPSPTPAPAPVVPGISPAQARTIIARCLPSGKPVPGGLQLFNAGRTPWGTRYLIYGPTTFVDCLHATEGDWRGGVTAEGQTRWLTGPLVVDRAIGDGAPNDRGPGTFTAEGRVVAAVTRVEIRYGSSRMTVPAVNGTFMAAVKVTAADISAGPAALFRAFGTNGQLVFESPAADNSHPVDKRCWSAPDGTVLPENARPGAGQKCLPATRWR